MDKIEMKVCSIKDLARLNMTLPQLLDRVVELDGNNGLNEETSGNEERLTAVFAETSGMWRFFMADGKIIGYWNCVPLNNEFQKRIEQGTLRERDINAGNIKKDLISEKNHLLFDSVCIDEHYQKMKLSGIVMKSIYDAFSALTPKGIEVADIWASIWSKDGISFFTKLGFTFHKANKFSGSIYRVSYSEMMNRLKSFILQYGLEGSKNDL